MYRRNAIQPIRILTFALLCAMAGACSTTQKSSSGHGLIESEPTAASVSEAEKAGASKAPGSVSQSKDTAAASQASTQAGGPAVATAEAPKGSPEVGATKITSEEVESEKRQLAEQEAKISKLRDAQETAQRRTAGEEANRQAQEVAAAAPARVTAMTEPAGATAAAEPAAAAMEPTAAPSARSASPVSATKPDDQMAVFPSNRNIANESGSRPVVQQPLQHSVYFDYDKAAIKEEYDSMLMAYAAALKSHPGTATEVQGNCDERGSREYNLALGARRAEAVKRALELLGADGRKIKTVSFGSEKPVALGKDEESYSQNRRADIVN